MVAQCTVLLLPLLSVFDSALSAQLAQLARNACARSEHGKKVSICHIDAAGLATLECAYGDNRIVTIGRQNGARQLIAVREV